MKRLVEWNCKEKGSALPIQIDELGNVVPLEDICAQLATIYDILGDDCDLDRLRALAEADRAGRCAMLTDQKSEDKIFIVVQPGQQVIPMEFHPPKDLSHIAQRESLYLEIEKLSGYTPQQLRSFFAAGCRIAPPADPMPLSELD